MLKNYFKIAIRHLTRHKLFSVINILCLAIGITFSMTIGIYILNQEAVNSHLKNVENQYIIKSKWKTKDMGLDITTLGPLAKTLKTEYPTLLRIITASILLRMSLVPAINISKKISQLATQLLSTCMGFRFCMATPGRPLRTIILQLLPKAWRRNYSEKRM